MFLEHEVGGEEVQGIISCQNREVLYYHLVVKEPCRDDGKPYSRDNRSSQRVACLGMYIKLSCIEGLDQQ